MVKWLAQRFQNADLRVAIVSRGYGATDGKHNDEALELAQALPNVPHVQNRDRVVAALRAIRAVPGITGEAEGLGRSVATDVDAALRPRAGLEHDQVICDLDSSGGHETRLLSLL